MEFCKVDKYEILFTTETDLSLDGYFCRELVKLTKEELIVKSEKRTEKYLIKDIEKIETEDLVFGGRLYIEINKKRKIICRYTKTKKTEFGKLVKFTKKIKSNKSIDFSEINNDKYNNFCPKCKTIYQDDRKICSKCINKKSIFFRLLTYIKEYKFKAVYIIVFMILHIIFQLLIPYVTGEMLFDETLKKDGFMYGKIEYAIVIIIGAYLFSTLTNIASNRMNAYVTGNIIYNIKKILFKSMQKLSIGFYVSKRTGSLMTNISDDIYRVEYFFHDGLPYIFIYSILLVCVITIMFVKNFTLTLLVLVPIPLMILISMRYFPNLYRKYGTMLKSKSTLYSIISDVLLGFRVVKAFGKENDEVNKFDNFSGKVKDTQLDFWKYVFTMQQVMNIIMMFSFFIVWGFGGWNVVVGKLKFGEMITFTQYVMILNIPLRFMSDFSEWWSSSMKSAYRIFEIVDSVPEISEKPYPLYKEKFEGKVQFKNVNFEYEPNVRIIENINLDIMPGETIGIVGRSGAGKSTLANLVMRLYDVKEGSLMIDGKDIREYSLGDLHRNISMVMQDSFLFNSTIIENIAYAKPEADIEEIIMASKAAYAHEFILKLPYGYDTIIGAGGVNLSGGEKQRLSIARTILHNPRIIILDEATASVDTQTEIYIQKAINQLVKNRTVISIAHRLSTLNNADRIYFIENGKIVEYGSHRELMNLKGEFYKMYIKQKKATDLRRVFS